MNDIISNLISNLKNAQKHKKNTLKIKKTDIIIQIVELLYKEGYLKYYTLDNNMITIGLRYYSDCPAIKEIKRVSKPSKRMYSSIKSIYSDGLGYFILTTPKGILTHIEAKKQCVGGEILFYIM